MSGTNRMEVGEITQKTNIKGEALVNALAEALECPRNISTKKVTDHKKKK